MGRRVDVAGYFEKLTRRGRGGRRLDGRSHDARDRPRPKQSARSDGGITDIFRDALDKGRSNVRRTAERVRTSTAERRRRAAPRRGLPPEGIVTIEYSPRIDGDPDPGEIVWTWVPFEEDPEQGKDRPVVVVGRRGRNLVGVPLTTKRSDREAQIAIGTGDWDPERRRSYARIWRMLDLESDGMRREGAVLDRDRFDQVVAALDEYYDVHRPSAPAVRADRADHEVHG